MSKKLEQGDLFLVSDVGEVKSFSIVLFSGPYDYQGLTQNEYDEGQDEYWINIGHTISKYIDIPVEELRAIVVEAIPETGDKDMLKALEQGKDGKHPAINYLGVLEDNDQLKEIHRLFMTDDEANQNMASAMVIGALNSTLGKLLVNDPVRTR